MRYQLHYNEYLYADNLEEAEKKFIGLLAYYVETKDVSTAGFEITEYDAEVDPYKEATA